MQLMDQVLRLSDQKYDQFVFCLKETEQADLADLIWVKDPPSPSGMYVTSV
mgnify:CR=1 FL=1